MWLRYFLLLLMISTFGAIPSVLAQVDSTWPKLERSYWNHFYEEEDSYSKKCYEELFFDHQGRLFLVPCGVEVLLNSIGLFRFDGYSFQPVEIRREEGNIRRQTWIKAIDYTGRFLGVDERKSLFIVDPDQLESKSIFTANPTLENLEILGISTTLEKTSILGSSSDHQVSLFTLEEDQLVEDASFDFLDFEDISDNFSILRLPESIWFSDFSLPVYRFDYQNQRIRAYGEQDFIGASFSPLATPVINERKLPKFLQHPNGNIFLFFSVGYENTLFQLNQETDQFLSTKDQFPSGWVAEGMFQDQAGNICFLFKDDSGAYRALLETVDGERFDYSAIIAGQTGIKTLASKNFQEQVFLLADKGLFVAGIREKGIIQNALEDYWVSSIAELPDERLLVNTIRNAWFVYDPLTGETIPFEGPYCGLERPAFGKGMKQQIIPDSLGNLWFVSHNYLVCYNPFTKDCKPFKLKQNGALFALLPNGLVAFQNNRYYLSLWDLKTQQQITPKPGVKTRFEEFIRDLLVDQQGRLWVATNNGLWMVDVDQGKSELLGPEQGFGDARFTTIFEAEDGRLWLGTYYGGLHVYDPQTGAIIIIDQGKGLSNNTVMSIIADDDGDIWVGTEYGINLVSKEGEVLSSIYEEDGLNYEIFERFDPFKSKDGLLYFGTRNGLNRINPQAFKKSMKRDTTVQIYLTELKYFNKERGEELIYKKNFNQLGQLEIAPERPYIHLKFGLSTYLETQNSRYAYLIEGIDEDWHYLGAQPELNISRLPPGKYRLLIKGADFRNNWTSKPIEISIHAREFFYKQAWFYCLAVLPFIAFGLIWARNKQQEANRLEKEVAQRTQKIQEDKTLIEQQAEELRQLDTLKSNFFTNISHELRTPIALIKGPLEHLLEKSKQFLDEANQKSLKLVLRNTSKLNRLVEELLELSSLEAQKVVLKETVTPLGHFCKLLFGAYESGATVKHIDYQFSSELNPNDFFLVDRTRLEKIINNLLSNAIKFTPESGRIRMQVRQEADQIQVVVKDNGRGIPPEDIPYLFNRYFQTRRKEISTEGGTGIGLVLAKELAELMNGQLKVKSKWGEGATFFLQFPAKKSEPSSADLEKLVLSNTPDIKNISIPSSPDSVVQKGKPKILIIEDNLEMQAFLQSLLQETYHCLIASHGAQAWSWLEAEEKQVIDIQLILSDVMMPEMDGYALLEKVKMHSKWQNLPIVMLTARSAEKDKLMALRMGVDDYLLKPFSPSELKARLKNLIANYQVRKQLENDTVDLSGAVKLEFNAALTPANQTWLKTVEDATTEAIQKRIRLSTSFLAQKVFLSERQFARKLKKISGLTPSEYIQEGKLQKARQLLENQVYSTVGEVANAVGYSSGSYLNKVYLERFGKNPSAYFS